MFSNLVVSKDDARQVFEILMERELPEDLTGWDWITDEFGGAKYFKYIADNSRFELAFYVHHDPCDELSFALALYDINLNRRLLSIELDPKGRDRYGYAMDMTDDSLTLIGQGGSYIVLPRGTV